MHASIKVNSPCEIINVTPCNPLISKCQIKVCYVGDEPNRNRSIITKDVAREMANSLPGSPIVGLFNEETQDFEEHSRSFEIEDGKFKIKDITKPYGFVDLGAKCWFQVFEDDGVQHEYLMTEGYIWSGQYPEAKRILEKGNNQSMELDENTLKATWTKDNNEKHKFFIINEAIISKLCILGEEFEPCFEGSQITKVQFSLEDSFKEQLFSMINEVKELLEGGNVADMEENKNIPVEEAQFSLEETEELEKDFKCGGGSSASSDGEKKKKEKEEDKKDKSDSENSEDNSEEDKSEKSEGSEDAEKPEEKKEQEDDEEDKKKKKYSLEEIPEYIDLASKFSELETKYNNLLNEKKDLESQNNALMQFKNNIEKKEKEKMINETFCMLSEEDKKDVIDHINEYSLDDIEAKLSIICVRNKVIFACLEEKDDEKDPTTYNLGSSFIQDEGTPAWVKAVLDTAKTLN